jgi:surfeit locus 1 family protein
MRLMGFLVLIVAVAAAAVCVRLGFWQLSRLSEKRALNAALRASEEAPEVVVAGDPPRAAQALDRSLQATGRFDEAHQFLLSGRFHDGEPGVEVVTPLRLEESPTAILVNRGWLSADDASTARPQDHPEPGVRTVRGVVEDMRHGAGGSPPRLLPGDSIALWSVRWLDADSIARRLPYPMAGYVVRQTPGAGVPGLPRRSRRPLHDEMVHFGYAIQWFLISFVILGGTAALAWSRRRRAGPLPTPEASS